MACVNEHGAVAGRMPWSKPPVANEICSTNPTGIVLRESISAGCNWFRRLRSRRHPPAQYSRSLMRSRGGIEVASFRGMKLMDRLGTAIRIRHFSPRTEEAYAGWVRRYIAFHGKRHPQEMGVDEIRDFITSRPFGTKLRP